MPTERFTTVPGATQNVPGPGAYDAGRVAEQKAKRIFAVTNTRSVSQTPPPFRTREGPLATRRRRDAPSARRAAGATRHRRGASLAPPDHTLCSDAPPCFDASRVGSQASVDKYVQLHKAASVGA